MPRPVFRTALPKGREGTEVASSTTKTSQNPIRNQRDIKKAKKKRK
jgi:hypothetical protein